MSYFDKTHICNRALDLVGKDGYTDFETSTASTALLVMRNWPFVVLRCLRRAQWPWAISRVTLSPSVTVPENEFNAAFTLPADVAKIIKIFPSGIMYKREGRYILCDESEITIKYVSDGAVEDPSVVDAAFAELLAHELAVSVSYKLTDSVSLRGELKKEAEARFREATALFSQEDEDDPMEESPWVTSRFLSDYEEGSIRIEGLET